MSWLLWIAAVPNAMPKGVLPNQAMRLCRPVSTSGRSTMYEDVRWMISVREVRSERMVKAGAAHSARRSIGDGM